MAEDIPTDDQEDSKEICAVPGCGKPAVTTVIIQVKPFGGPDHVPGEQKYVPVCAEHAAEVGQIGVGAFGDKYFG